MTVGNANLPSDWVTFLPVKLGSVTSWRDDRRHQSPVSVENKLGWDIWIHQRGP